jgi:hypothetical protein
LFFTLFTPHIIFCIHFIVTFALCCTSGNAVNAVCPIAQYVISCGVAYHFSATQYQAHSVAQINAHCVNHFATVGKLLADNQVLTLLNACIPQALVHNTFPQT